ncbi:OLC1v1019735C2 [Oldenlandia corymbosa var. corymbosa]|nr:OLC1v1019735C2 [Oldenlandia corymbosa var. corymbosa]
MSPKCLFLVLFLGLAIFITQSSARPEPSPKIEAGVVTINCNPSNVINGELEGDRNDGHSKITNCQIRFPGSQVSLSQPSSSDPPSPSESPAPSPSQWDSVPLPRLHAEPSTN